MSQRHKVLCICDDMLPPNVYSSGAKSILNLEKNITGPEGELHVLTSVTRYTDSQWQSFVAKQKEQETVYHVLNSPLRNQEGLWKILTRFLYCVKAVALHRKHGFSVIHLYSSSPLLIQFAGLIKLFTGTRVIHTLCTCFEDWQKKKTSPFLKPDRVVYTTEQLKSVIGPKVTSQYLPIPIEDRFFTETEVLKGLPKKKPGEIILAYVGLLSSRKGADDFLSSARCWLDIPNVKILLATPKGRKETLENAELKEQIEGILSDFPDKFIYLEENLDVSKLFKYIDILVYPLRTMDGTLGTPSTLVEAMASGVAVVASDLPELCHFIRDQENGVLTPTGELALLSQKVELLINAPDQLEKIKKAAVKTALPYGLKAVLPKYQALYFQPS